jgi:hypothetical protein
MMRSVNDGDLAPDRLLASARGCGDRQMFSLKPFHDQIVRKIRGLPAADTEASGASTSFCDERKK